MTANSGSPAFLFDLDGTLVDSVYQHVLAWREALQEMGIELAVWRIHRRIGMSGGLLVNALSREVNRKLSRKESERLIQLHSERFKPYAETVRLLPGARELLRYLTRHKVKWAIATSGLLKPAKRSLAMLDVPSDVPIITRDEVVHAKPDPDLFLAAAARLRVAIMHSVVVGDSVWDLLAARRAQAIGVGVLSGGYGYAELESAGAYRVYADPADLLEHIDEVGVRTD
jgi:HAD superfamily hydrolase (TIGR01509 family)